MKLACRHFIERLGDCLDGCGSDAHLRACPKCRVILETTRRTVRLYHDWPPCCVPPDVESRLWAALHLSAGGVSGGFGRLPNTVRKGGTSP